MLLSWTLIGMPQSAVPATWIEWSPDSSRERPMRLATFTGPREIVLLGLLALTGRFMAILARADPARMGLQLDGSFLVSSGQRVEAGSIAFRGRPIDLAMHPRDAV